MRFTTPHTTIDLDGEWRLAFSKDQPQNIPTTIAEVNTSGLAQIPARVPGNLELDLQRAGLLPEPFYGLNMLQLREWESCHVWYFRRFSACPAPGCLPQLVFEGIDCYAEVYLNGVRVGSSDNMLVEQIFAVGDALRAENELVVHIRPTLLEAQNYEYPPLLTAGAINQESLYVRKAPHMFGWDIMPRALSAGLWRSVRLQYIPQQRLEEAYLQTIHLDGSGKTARLRLWYKAQLDDPTHGKLEVQIEGRCQEHSFSHRQPVFFSSGNLIFDVNQPRLWHPRGRGEPNLYAVTLTLFQDGEEIDQLCFTHGIRTIRLERSSTTDEEGSGEFCFYVNGEKVFIKGTNWVPLDAFHSRDLQRLEQVFPLLLESGCNLVRCWGGNVYESDHFFDLCDQHGILIWQDFSMACAVYPQDEIFQQRLATEARQVVKRLRQHACLALWAGDNECDQAHAWGLGADPNENVLTRVVLPGALRQEDPLRPYLPSSPYVDRQAYTRGERYLPENHLWGPRDYYKSDFYRGSLCHFASEIGYHGCPHPHSIRRFISPERVWPYQNNPEWLLHATAPVPESGLYAYRVELMANQIRELFGRIPDNLEDFAFASQVSQAEAKKFFIELFRGSKWRRTGIIWWNLVDGWPQFSDAVVDYFLRKKLAFDYIRTAQQDVLVMLREAENWQQQILAVNDMRQAVDLEFSLRDIEANTLLAQGKTSVPGDSSMVIGALPFSASEKGFYLIEWRAGDARGASHYLKGTPPFDLEQYRAWLELYRQAAGWLFSA